METTEQVIEHLIRLASSSETCTIDQYRDSLHALVALAKAEIQQEYVEVDGQYAVRKFRRVVH